MKRTSEECEHRKVPSGRESTRDAVESAIDRSRSASPQAWDAVNKCDKTRIPHWQEQCGDLRK